MKNYTIKPLKWKKDQNLHFAVIDIIGYEEMFTILEGDAGKFNIALPYGDPDGKSYKDVKTLADAKAKAQSLWEKELGKFLKEVK